MVRGGFAREFNALVEGAAVRTRSGGSAGRRMLRP